MNTVYLGSDEFGLPTLEALARSDRHRLRGVVSQPDRPAGRGRRLTPTPVAAWARRRGLPLSCPPSVNQPEARAALAGWGGDVGVVIAFGQKIGDEVLNAFRHGCVNLHASLLPRLRGAAPVARAIVNGDRQTGVTVFRLVARIDAGPIVGQQATPIDPAETAEELAARLAAMGPQAVLDALDAIEQGRASFVPQDDSLATAAPKLGKADGVVDWSQPADQIANRIRGLYPWPGVRARFISHTGRTEELVLARAVAAPPPDSADSAGDSARDVGVLRQDLAVTAGQGAVRLLEVKPAGRRLMSFADFVNGRRVSPGDRFVACPE